jgi:hypothetical protein
LLVSGFLQNGLPSRLLSRGSEPTITSVRNDVWSYEPMAGKGLF